VCVGSWGVLFIRGVVRNDFGVGWLGFGLACW
jgi:hypothetical protein